MDLLETIKTRRSVRTFDGLPLSEEHQEALRHAAGETWNPFGIPVSFVFLNAQEHGLSTPVIKGETLYVAAKVARIPYGEEALGYSFEKLMLSAWAMGIGTTWIGGTMKRELFEKAAGVGPDERMCCVSPLGYPAKRMSLKETAMRMGIRADQRKPNEELFFDGDLSTPLNEKTPQMLAALEAVRLAPSAANKQPWRVIRRGEAWHFFLKHDRGYASDAAGDMQKVDMGIAICHFMSMAGGKLRIRDPGIPLPEGTEYTATVMTDCGNTEEEVQE